MSAEQNTQASDSANTKEVVAEKPVLEQPAQKQAVAKASQQPARGTTVIASAPRVINIGVEDVNTIPVAKSTKPVPSVSGVNPNTRLGSVVSSLTKKDKVVATSPKDLVADLLSDVPEAYQYPITRLFAYIDKMNPKRPESEKVGSIEQVALYHSIINIINNEKYFEPLFTALLRLFNNYSTPADVFHEYNASRFIQSVPLNVEERRAFNNLVCFLRLMANPKTRAINTRTMDHSRLLSHGLSEEGRNRVVAFMQL